MQNEGREPESVLQHPSCPASAKDLRVLLHEAAEASSSSPLSSQACVVGKVERKRDLSKTTQQALRVKFLQVQVNKTIFHS